MAEVKLLFMAVSSLAAAVEAVAGLRWRDSCRRLVTPLSLLKDEALLKDAVDLLCLWPLVKLLLDLENMLMDLTGKRSNCD